MSMMRITGGKGVHFTFENGATISIQIGGGNYSDNYDFPIGDSTYDNPLPPSGRAEIAAWAELNEMVEINGDTVAGYVPMSDVFEAINVIRSIPSPATSEALQIALNEWHATTI